MTRSRSQRNADAQPNAITELRSDPVFLVAQLLVFTKITLLLVLFDPAAADAFSLPKSTASHAVTYLLLAAAAYLLLRHPAAVLRYSPAHLAVIAVLAVFALASVFAISQDVAFFGASRRYLGLTQMADNVVLYFAACVLFPTAKDLSRLFVVAAAATLPVVAYAIVQRLGFDPVTYAISTVGRASTTLGQPDIAGGFLSIAVATFAAVLVFAWRPIGAVARVAVALLIVVTLAALYFTGSRAGILGLASGALAAIALGYQWRPSRRRLLLGATAGVVILSVLLVAVTPLGARLRPDALVNDPSLLTRVEIWGTAARAAAEHPMLGLGPDNFVAAYPALRTERSFFLSPTVLENSTHNWFLYFLTSAGPIAALAAVALIAVALVTALMLARRRDLRALLVVPLLAYLGQGLVNVNDVGLDWVFWLTTGALVSSVAAPVTRRLRAAPVASSAVAALLVLVAALYGVYVSRDRLTASEFFGREEALSTAAQGLPAVDAARQAVAIDPRRAEYWSGFGRALLAAGNPGAAAQGFQAAADREPWQPLYWRDLAIARVSAGDTKGAVTALHRAIAADAYDAEAHALLARLAYSSGAYDEALSEGRIAVHLQPTNRDEYAAPVQAAIALGKLSDAAELLKTGIQQTDFNLLRNELAEVYDAEGRRDLALALVREVLARDPLDGIALQLLDKYTKP